MVVCVDQPRDDHVPTGIDDTISGVGQGVGRSYRLDHTISNKDAGVRQLLLSVIHRRNDLCLFNE